MPDAISHSLVRRLAEVPIFSALDERALLRVLGASANLHWASGSVVFEAGGPAEALYIVITGSVEIMDPEGNVLAELGEDSFFGELGLLHDARYTRTARTSADTELMVVRREWFEALLQSDPEIAAHFRRAFEDRLATARVAEPPEG